MKQNLAVIYNTIELHYWLEDNSHTMDAMLQNKCEAEFLKIIEEISLIFNCEISTYTGPLENGGIRRFFKLQFKKKTSTVLAVIITATIGKVIALPIDVLGDLIVQNLSKNYELEELQEENLRLKNTKLRLEVDEMKQKAASSKKLRRHKSNFYTDITKISNLKRISTVSFDSSGRNIYNESYVERQEFQLHILPKEKAEFIVDNEAEVEIVAPILNKENYKWKGIYKGNLISFDMMSTEFKTKAQSGLINFKTGSKVICMLTMKSEIDDNGVEKLSEFKIVRIDKYYLDSESSIETDEGKVYRKKKKYTDAQLGLFD